MLFVKKIRGQYDLNDCIYIDNKYFHEVGFTPAQQKITQPFKDKLGEAEVEAINILEDIYGNRIADIGDHLKIRRIEIFTIDKDLNLVNVFKY